MARPPRHRREGTTTSQPVLTAVFDRQSRIRDVLSARPDGREVLLGHGYNLGEGFVDILSQYQTLEDAYREGRLRDLDLLLATLNEESG
jgi:hypothetical protein